MSRAGSPVRPSPRPRSNRRGFNVVGIILLVMILAGAALVYSQLARQAGRGSHWFLDAQTAYDLADAGLKEAVFWLDQANNAGRASAAPFMAAGLQQAFDALATGADGTQVILVSHEDAATLTPSLRTQLDRLSGASPKLTVVFRLESSQPLWTGLLQGIPANPKEKKSVVSIVATGSIQTPAGIRVERTITTSRGARVVSILPPVVGRFALFVHPQSGGQDANTVARRYDPATGDARPEGASGALVIKQPAAPSIMTNTSTVARPAFVNALGPKFLDHQGWVFLGGTDAAPWKLNLAHGYSDGGDSPLLPGDRGRHLFRGTQAEDDQFGRRFEVEFRSHPGRCLLSARPDTVNPRRGLYHLHHGTATNYEIIGLTSNVYREVQRGGARFKMDFGNVPASSLRLFGEPRALGPTLVFGPALRTYFRRSSVLATMSPPGQCPSFGDQLFNLYRLADHSPRTQATARAAFVGDAGYAEHGTNRVENEPYVESLNVLLDSRGAGAYGPDGVLYRLPDAGGPAKTFSSDRLPALGTLPAAGGIPDAVLNQLVRGDVTVANLYTGNLHNGLAAFQAALAVKLAFTVKAEAFGTRVLVNKVLKVPGIAKVLGPSLDIGAVDKIANGGILVSDGPVRIRGDIVRGGTQEPLTIVSLAGGITVEGGVRNVEAQLVALGAGGKIALPGGGFTLRGGLAARELDLPSLQGGTAPRVIEYTEDLDPLGPNVDASLRAFYGNDPRVSVDGGGL